MLTAGAASCEITNDLGTLIQGATVGGVAQSVRDPLEANALYLRDESGGEATSLLLVSCDLGGLEPHVVADARARMAEACGLSPRSILVGATHTGGPSVIPTNYQKPVDEGYLDRLCDWLASLAQRAVAAARPARLAWGQGEVEIGYNRRCCWADGSHTMHGNTSRPDFTGLEGPNDPTHTALAVADKQSEQLIAVLHVNTAHPCTFYGADFYSADFPGAARQYLRDALGPIPILFFNGALGDIATEDLTTQKPRSEPAERKLARLAHLITGETLRLLYQSPWRDEMPIAHAHEDLSMPVRLPDEQTLQWAQQTLARVDAGEDVPRMEVALAHGSRLLQQRYGETPVDHLAIHALRIDDLAILTQPCELFCQFGLDIRRRSPAPHTAIVGLTDGYHGYCPTTAAMLGGGYSAQPIYWTRLAADAGDRIVDASSRLLRTLWHT